MKLGRRKELPPRPKKRAIRRNGILSIGEIGGNNRPLKKHARGGRRFCSGMSPPITRGSSVRCRVSVMLSPAGSSGYRGLYEATKLSDANPPRDGQVVSRSQSTYHDRPRLIAALGARCLSHLRSPLTTALFHLFRSNVLHVRRQ